MPRFQYTAIDPQQRPIEGVVDAESLAAAVVVLEATDLSVQSISQADAEGEACETLATPQLANAVQRVIDARDQLAGPLLAYAKELPRGPRRRELRALGKLVDAGNAESAISDAATRPTAWGPLLAAAAGEGESSVFTRFVDREQQRSLVRRHRGIALAYPLFVAGLALLVSWPIAVFLLPTFSEIYKSFGLDLPIFTRLILAVGRFLESGGVYVLVLLMLLLAFVVIGLPRWTPSWLVRLRDNVTARGGGRASDQAQLAMSASDLIEAGLAPAESLAVCGASIGGSSGKRAERLSRQLADGSDKPTGGALAFALTQEMTDSARSALLRDLSQCHQERELGHTFWVNGFAAPAATIAVGVVVGMVVVALFLPLLRLIQGLT